MITILLENQLRIANIFILITLGSISFIFIAAGLMALLGNEVIITSNFSRITETKYFTVGKGLRDYLIIILIFV